MLQEHQVYLDGLAGAFDVWLQAFSTALEAQDDPGAYNMAQFNGLRAQLSAALGQLNGYLAGTGPSGAPSDDLRIYASPSNLTGSVTFGSLLNANLPRLLP